MTITDKVYVKNHQQLVSQLDTSFPKSAFAGATLDVLFSGEGMSNLDESSRERVLAFAESFLDCDCQSSPFCGCPEEKFISYLLDLRSQGFGPEAIVDIMSDDYMVYAYPGDILSFLDSAVRTLEAAERLAQVDNNDEMARRIGEKRTDLVN